MKLEVMDKRYMTFDLAIQLAEELYVIEFIDDRNGFRMTPLNAADIMNLDEYTIVRLNRDKKEAANKPIEEKKTEESKLERVYERLTYKYWGKNLDETIQVVPKTDGSIRISFNEKDDAESYFEHFRKMFYKHNSHADYITVATIYKELGIVKTDENESKNWNEWLYPTIENGHCTFMSNGINLTKGTKQWGFTLGRPKSMTSYTSGRN